MVYLNSILYLLFGIILLSDVEESILNLNNNVLGNWTVSYFGAYLLMSLCFFTAFIGLASIRTQKALGSFLSLVFLADFVLSFSTGSPILGNLLPNWLIGLTLLVNGAMLFKSNGIKLRPILKRASVIASVIVLSTPFIIYPIWVSEFEEPEISLAEPTQIQNIQVLAAEAKPNQLLCFFSTGCPHCKMMAKKIEIARKHNPDFPEAYIVFLGDQVGVDYFFEQTGVDIENYTFTDQYDQFLDASGAYLPAIFYQNSQQEMLYFTNKSFNYNVLENFTERFLSK